LKKIITGSATGSVAVVQTQAQCHAIQFEARLGVPIAVQTKSAPPKAGGLMIEILVDFAQAAIATPSRNRRYVRNLSPAKPRIFFAQVDGSGTAK
jgi:hypothetical protein